MAVVLGCAIADVKAKIENLGDFDKFKQLVTDAIAGTGAGGVAIALSPAQVDALKKVSAKLASFTGKTHILIEKDTSNKAMEDFSNAATTLILGNKLDAIIDNIDFDEKEGVNQGKDRPKASVNIADWENFVAKRAADTVPLVTSQEVCRLVRIIIRDTAPIKIGDEGHYYGNVTLILDVPSVGEGQRLADNTSILLVRLRNKEDSLMQAIHNIDNGASLKLLIEACEQIAKNKALDKPLEVAMGAEKVYIACTFENRIAGRTTYTSNEPHDYQMAVALKSQLAIMNPRNKTTSCQLYHTQTQYAFRGLGECSTEAKFNKSVELAEVKLLAEEKRNDALFAADIEASMVGRKLKGVLDVLKDANVEGLNIADIVGKMVNIG